MSKRLSHRSTIQEEYLTQCSEEIEVLEEIVVPQEVSYQMNMEEIALKVLSGA